MAGGYYIGSNRLQLKLKENRVHTETQNLLQRLHGPHLVLPLLASTGKGSVHIVINTPDRRHRT